MLPTKLRLAAALRLTADPPTAWIEAAAAIRPLLGDWARIEQIVTDAEFRQRFAADPGSALVWAGLPATAPVVSAVRGRLD